MTKLKIFFLIIGLAGVVLGAPIPNAVVLTRAKSWMASDQIMQNKTLEGAAVERFPSDASDGFVYVVSLEAGGYLILNSDDQLPLVVAYSPSGSVCLEDRPENALRGMLAQYVEVLPEQIENAEMKVFAAGLPSGDVIYGPYLETQWDQCNPYNLLCPVDPGEGLNGYDGRVPAGCVPVAYAQVLNYHRWPVHGVGSHNYTDSVGATKGPHSADFSDPYDWGNMLSSYPAFSSVEPEQEAAISELMYELGVGTEINYETNGSSASIVTLGTRITTSFYFEQNSYKLPLSTLKDPMENDLMNGFPVVVGINGHAIVADGVRVQGSNKTYHINYGWGGVNDGWWAATGVSGSPILYGVTGIRPRLMPFPVNETVETCAGSPFEFRWILPKRRVNEVQSITVQVKQGSGSWVSMHEDTELRYDQFSQEVTLLDGADDFSFFEETSAYPDGKWVVVTNDGHTAFQKMHSEGYRDYQYHLTSRGTVMPTANTRLLLKMKTDSFASGYFRVLVSTNRTAWTEVGVLRAAMNWEGWPVDLSAYAGVPVYLRLEYVLGSYYIGHGTWIDAISFQEVTNPELEGQSIHRTAVSGWDEGTYTAQAFLTDTNGIKQSAGPEFAIRVNPSWGITSFGLVGNTVQIGFPSQAGYLYAVEYKANLLSSTWIVLSNNLPGTGSEIEIFDSVEAAMRFYRLKRDSL